MIANFLLLTLWIIVFIDKYITINKSIWQMFSIKEKTKGYVKTKLLQRLIFYYFLQVHLSCEFSWVSKHHYWITSFVTKNVEASLWCWNSFSIESQKHLFCLSRFKISGLIFPFKLWLLDLKKTGKKNYSSHLLLFRVRKTFLQSKKNLLALFE